jgi:hypothetical protein
MTNATATKSETQTIVLSSETLDVLKNFSGINSNLIVTPGNILHTMSPVMSIVGKAKVDETFEVPFGIFDLGEFLALVSTFQTPEFTFETNRVTVKEAGAKTSDRLVYHYSPTNLLTDPKSVKEFDSAVSFQVRSAVLDNLFKRAAIGKFEDLAIESTSDGDILLRAFNEANPSSNSVSVTVGKNTSKGTFRFLFKIETIRLIPGTYDVHVAPKKISHWVNTKTDLQYWIAQEQKSTYSA